MPLPRPCSNCGKRFQPNSKDDRLCLECWELKRGKGKKHLNNTRNLK